MNQRLAHITLIVHNYDEAIAYYTQILKFKLIEDTQVSETRRWVLISPQAENGCSLSLAEPENEEQKKYIGNQAGGKVFLFLHTDDFKTYFQNLIDHKVKIIKQPVIEKWGTVAIFSDLYGNLWDLIEPCK